MDLLIFRISVVSLIFFWLKGFPTRYFRLCYCWLQYLQMLITHFFILACFCSKLFLFILLYLVFFTFFFWFCIASGAKLSFASVSTFLGFRDEDVYDFKKFRST